MDCRILCMLLVVACAGGSFAYHHGGYQEPHGRFYGYHHPAPRYGHGYIQGAIYKRGHGHHGDSRGSSDESQDHGDSHEDDDDEDHHAYKFQIADDYDAYGYTDSNGEAHGFLIDLMRAVCERAHKHCFFVVDTSSHCWDTSHNRELPGVGLLDHYYDGCLGYWQSAIRKNSFNFSVPFTPDVQASLHYKAGVTVENPTTVTGAKIGFVSGWPISHGCFERQSGFDGNSPGKYTPVQFDTHAAMLSALQAGEINALVTTNTHDDEKLGIQHVDPSFHCTLAGASVMTPYGSDVLSWWNGAFNDMRADGSFRRLCQSAARIHASHGEVHCIDF